MTRWEIFKALNSGMEILLIARSAAGPSSAAATATTAAILGAGTRFIHVQLPSLHLPAIETADGRLRFLGARHLYKSESLGMAAGLVLNDGRGRYLPEFSKSLT
jgi:hypothetical protein